MCYRRPALEPSVVSHDRGSEIYGEEVLVRGESEGSELVVVPAEQVVLVPGPVRRDQDVVVVAAVTGLGPDRSVSGWEGDKSSLTSRQCR